MKFQLRQQPAHRVSFHAQLFHELSLLVRTGFLKMHQQSDRLKPQVAEFYSATLCSLLCLSTVGLRFVLFHWAIMRL